MKLRDSSCSRYGYFLNFTIQIKKTKLVSGRIIKYVKSVLVAIYQLSVFIVIKYRRDPLSSELMTLAWAGQSGGQFVHANTRPPVC